MSHLPEEVVADEILSRLPVKPLLQFRCVSVPWRVLIDSSYFVKLHLNRSIERKTDRFLILGNDHLYAADFDSLDAVVKAVKLDHDPLRPQDFRTKVWGSCNGLLCLSSALHNLVLWNPSTGESRELPYASIEFKKPRYFEIRVYGFGYDSLSDDYKVVRIVMNKGDDFDSYHYEVKVYSLKSNSWHGAEKFPQYHRHPHLERVGGVLASGALHWVVTQEPQPGLIVAFDLGSEKYRLVPQPEYKNTNFYMNVGTLGGCLSVACNYYSNCVDIWVMKEYGVKDSWTKLISMEQTGSISSFQYVRPVAYSKSGEEVLLERITKKKKVLLEQDTKRLLWYSLKTNKVKNVRVQGTKDLLQVDVCSGTLVSLKGDDKVDWKKQPSKKRRIYDFNCEAG